MRVFKLMIAAVFAAAALSAPAFAQSSRQIKFIVPFPAGGGGDVLTRIVAEKWAQAYGVATVIENRPGAATVLGAEATFRAAPDGNTLGTVANSFIIHPNFKKLSYDPLTGFEPVCLLASSPQVIVVSNASPYKTLKEWLDAARARPGELTHASVGPASPQHIAFEQLKLLAKVSITFVPFNGNTPALNALLGDHVGSVMSNYSEAAELVKSGKLRALAVASGKRVGGWPDVPTVAEQGFKDYSVEAWYGLVAPAKTPKEQVAELAKWCAGAMSAPELKAKWEAQGLTPAGSTSEQFAAHLRKQSEDYARVIREANIKGE
ncbi:MAG: tripartite tricarboxylate transporter substrate binding protein [Alphaproteobacteria bacterium]|nr:tripartite tricarboxylate transporter substrate binding protein [Alphaproteobacteria bacterium]